MFSKTVRRGKMLVTWKLCVRPRRWIWKGRHALDPGTVQQHGTARGAMRPLTRLNSVDLLGAVRTDDRVALALVNVEGHRADDLGVAPKLLLRSRNCSAIGVAAALGLPERRCATLPPGRAPWGGRDQTPPNVAARRSPGGQRLGAARDATPERRCATLPRGERLGRPAHGLPERRCATLPRGASALGRPGALYRALSAARADASLRWRAPMRPRDAPRAAKNEKAADQHHSRGEPRPRRRGVDR